MKLNLMKITKVFIIIIFAFLTTYLSKPLYGISELSVSFEAETSKELVFQIYYTHKSDGKFNGNDSLKKIVKSGNHHIEFVLPIKKIVKFRIDTGSRPGNVTLSNIKISGDRTVKLENGNNFSYSKDVEQYSVDKNKIIIKSNKPDPYLIYNKELNVSAGYQLNAFLLFLIMAVSVIAGYFAIWRKNYTGGGICVALLFTTITIKFLDYLEIKIDFYAFVILATIYFFLTYKIGKYLSRLKIEEHHSRIDIVLVSCFFLALFIPMMHISQAEKSEQENRMLATYKPLFQDKKLNLNFGKDFDAWFSDRFLGRAILVKLKRFVFRGDNDHVMRGMDNWLFYKLDNGLYNFANKTELSQNKLEQGLNYLKKLDTWCKKHNKKFYYVIAPDKNKIYGEYIHKIRKQRDDSYGIGFQFSKYIKDNSDINVIYLYDTLHKNKNKGVLYYKTDTHWNYYGAYWGYKEIEKHLLKDFSFEPLIIEKWTNEKQYVHDLNKVFGRNKIYDNTIYKRPSIAKSVTCQITKKYERPDSLITCYNSEALLNKKAFILRDSFSQWLKPYYQRLFNDFALHWKYSTTKEDLKDIDKNYDIVILENVERLTPQILNQSFPKD